jgi:hypothetical protein
MRNASKANEKDKSLNCDLNGTVQNLCAAKRLSSAFWQQARKNPAQYEFGKWFNGSLVADKKGRPIVQHHTTEMDIGNTPFWLLSHFGTAAAAEHFSKELKNYRFHSNTYDVVLSIRKPLGLPDFKQHNPTALAGKFRHFGIITPQEYQYIYGTGFAGFCRETHPDHQALIDRKDYLIEKYGRRRVEKIFDWRTPNEFWIADRLVQNLESKGYDGLVYMNRGEDPGSMTWTPFRGSQVRPVFAARGAGIEISPETSFQLRSDKRVLYPQIDNYITNSLPQLWAPRAA